MDEKTLNRPRWFIRRWLGRLTWPWLVAGGLLGGGAGLYLSVIEPARHEMADVRRNVISLQQEYRLAEKTASATSPDAAPDRLALFYNYFPPESSLPDWLQKIIEAAGENQLSLRQGDYHISRVKTGKLMRYQLTLPVKGAYPHIRGFIDSVLAEVPIASLDNVKFERQKIGDAAVEATVLLTLHLESAS